MNNTIISTLPLKPRSDMKIFHYIIPTLVSETGKLLNCKTCLMINNIGNYENLNKDTYISNLRQRNIKFDDIKVDKNYLPFLIECIQKLLKDNKIIEKICEIYTCNCGKLNLVKNGVRSFSKGDFYHFDNNGNVICNFCNSKAVLKKQKTLVINSLATYYKPNVCPLYMEKIINNLFTQRVEGDIIISKERNTGVSLTLNNHTYFLDVDFVWANFPQLFKEKNIIIFTSTDLAYESFIVNIINNLHNNKNVFIVHQAKIISNNIENLIMALDNERFKLNIIFNTNLKSYTTSFNSSIYDTIKKCNSFQLNTLFSYPGYKRNILENTLTPKIIENSIKYGFNFQFNKKYI